MLVNRLNSNMIYVGDNLSIMASEDFSVYKNRVDFIYIDPPYNTRSRLSFVDNNKSWADDIMARLMVAKDMMSETGVIFISIDDNELMSLLSVCYEVFGKDNYVGMFITKQAIRSNAKHINTVHEYVVCFAKNRAVLPKFYIRRMADPSEAPEISAIIKRVKDAKSDSEAKAELKRSIDAYVRATGQTWIKNYNNIDEDRNVFFAKDLSTPGKPNRLDIDEIDLHLAPLKTRGWMSRERFIELHNAGRLCYKNGRPYCKEYLYEATNNVISLLDFYSRQGTNALKKLDLYGLFDAPKPVELIKFLIRASQHEDALVMDFYAGSGTTAEAVYELNREDDMHHQYILIQLDEPINERTDSYALMTSLGYEHPCVSDAMLVRINRYLESVNAPVDYTIISEK